MTREEKELLVKDLCARLPYNPKVKYAHYHKNGDDVDIVLNVYNAHKLLVGMGIYHIKPYLRKFNENGMECYRWENFKTVSDNMRYLIENHYDINHLIERGLAIEAPEGMYDMTMEELNEMLKEELPKELLTEEQFKEVSAMDWPHAVKYIHSTTNIGLKMSKCYYDMYVTKNQQQ